MTEGEVLALEALHFELLRHFEIVEREYRHTYRWRLLRRWRLRAQVRLLQRQSDAMGRILHEMRRTVADA